MMKTFSNILLIGSVLCAILPSVAATWDVSHGDIGIVVESGSDQIDPGRPFDVTVTATAPAGRRVQLPDLRDRFQGFQVAEDFTEDPLVADDGKTTIVSRWRLLPEPLARRYRLAPFVVTVQASAVTNGVAAATESTSFYTEPIRFTPPAARETVTGDMELHVTRDFPPLSWKLAGWIALAVAGVLAIGVLLYFVVRKIRLLIRIHRMSPIERALYELEVLLGKNLPGRGFYKDFYVELTMVVRRYIERRHAVKAPNLTTDEFLRAAQDNPAFPRAALAELKQFLESADMVKFAGVESTPEMADAATNRARGYLDADNAKQKTEDVK